MLAYLKTSREYDAVLDFFKPMLIRSRGLPSATGLKLHVKLAQILGRAVEKIYGYGGRGSRNPGSVHMHHFLDELENWRSEVHHSLDIARCLEAEAPRDLLTLHMAYNQVCIFGRMD